MSLNAPHESVVVTAEVDRFKEFEGFRTDAMPALLADRRKPMSFLDIANRRLEVINSKGFSEFEKRWWWDNYVDSADGARRSPDGSLKIAYDSQNLRSLTPRTKLSSTGAIVLSDQEFSEGEGPTFSRAVAESSSGKYFPNVEAVVDDPLWQGLVREDDYVLRELAKATFAMAKDRYERTETMRILVPEVPKDAPIERLWVAGSLGSGRGGASGDNYLYIKSGRLVGKVAPEAQLREGGAAAVSAPRRKELEQMIWNYLRTTPAPNQTRKDIGEILRSAYSAE